MQKRTLWAAALAAGVVLGIAVVSTSNSREPVMVEVEMTDPIPLPAPATDGDVSLERTLAERRSRRAFSDAPLSLAQAGQVLWSAQGLTEGRFRTAPSAGATYPLEAFIAVGDGTVGDLAAGVYRYRPSDHGLVRILEGDIRARLAQAALGQGFIADAPMAVVIAAQYARTTARYGERGRRYVHMEVGHAGGNIYLQCQAMGLGTVAVGAFNDRQVDELMGWEKELNTLYIMPVGHVR